MNLKPPRYRLGVALDVPTYARMGSQRDGLEGLVFDYLCDQAAQPGQRIIVPFGRQTTMGIVVGPGEGDLPADKLRPALGVLDDIAPLNAHWLALTRFAAHYYQRGLGEVALPALPALLRRSTGYQPQADGQLRSRSIELQRKALARWPSRPSLITAQAPPLNEQQRAAARAIRAALSGFTPFLLYGVTGSGKTEVYLDVIAEVIGRGAQVLVLVPEINLAPPFEALLKQRFGARAVASLHSGMAEGARALNWLACHSGAADVLVGTRMAVMASLPRLGLIVVDEEHDPSFKQQEGLRYSARDLALVRAKEEGVPVVLGSATPSLESWHLARRGRYRLLELPARAAANAAMPAIVCVNTRRLTLEHGFSPALKEALANCLSRREQALMFVNRRGYAPVVHCGACGWISDCARCSAHAVFHKIDRRLHCHHCGWQAPTPKHCPSCGNADLAPLGRGTQRVEETLMAWFPEARVARLDRDASQARGRAAAVLAAFHAGDIDVLVGTQMLAKGHDFKNLTLVGVLGADSALYSHDFRAPERLFANLAQVAGRAGRADKSGRVLVQSDYCEHPLFDALRRHDYSGFADALLKERKEALLPPFSYQAILRAEARSLAEAVAFLTAAKDAADALADAHAVSVYDPVPMGLMRRADLERAQLLFEASSRPQLQRFLPRLIEALRAQAARVAWHVEVDPLDV